MWTVLIYPCTYNHRPLVQLFDYLCRTFFLQITCGIGLLSCPTFSSFQYADPVCDRIDPSGHFKHRLFRESCVCLKSNYIKHLDVLGRDIEQICIIDNSPISFYFHRQNAVCFRPLASPTISFVPQP